MQVGENAARNPNLEVQPKMLRHRTVRRQGTIRAGRAGGRGLFRALAAGSRAMRKGLGAARKRVRISVRVARPRLKRKES